MPRRLQATKTSHGKVSSYFFSLYRDYSNSLTLSHASELFWSWISINHTQLHEENEFCHCLFTSYTKREIRHFHDVVQLTATKCTKKRYARAKLLFCLIKLLLIWTFSSPPHVKLPIIYNTLWSVKNRIFSRQIELLLLIASHTLFRLIGSSFLSSLFFRKVENISFLCTHKLGERTGRNRAKNSGETIRRLGTIIQSIFCAQSGAGIRYSSVGVGTQGLVCPYLKTFIPPFLPTRLTAPGSPRMMTQYSWLFLLSLFLPRFFLCLVGYISVETFLGKLLEY